LVNSKNTDPGGPLAADLPDPDTQHWCPVSWRAENKVTAQQQSFVTCEGHHVTVPDTPISIFDVHVLEAFSIYDRRDFYDNGISAPFEPCR
jgi:hypothetical protein